MVKIYLDMQLYIPCPHTVMQLTRFDVQETIIVQSIRAPTFPVTLLF